MSGLRQRGVGSGGGLDLQPAIADDQLACEMQGRDEARRSECPLRRDGHAADPKPAQAFVVGALSDPRKQCAQHAPTPKRLEREAVPDVGLARVWRDRQLELPDPCPKASTASGQPSRDEIAFGVHRGRDRRRGGRIDLSDFDRGCGPILSTRQCPAGSADLPGERRGERRTRNVQVRRPESASNQMEKWRWRTLWITSGAPLAEPPGYRPKNVSTRSWGESNLNTAAAPSKSPFSASGVHFPSLTVIGPLPPHGPATSIP